MFYPHAIVSSSPSFTVGQLTDLSPAHNFVDLAERTLSDIGPTYTGSRQATPAVQFGTTDVATMLGIFTNTGVCRDLSAGNVDLEYKAGVNRGMRVADATTSHLRLRASSNAYAAWESLQADAGGNAELRGRIVPIFDGTNDPLIPTASVAITATSTSVANLWTLGPIKLNGTTLDLVQGFNWQNNVEYDEHVADRGFLTWSSIRAITPVVTIRTKKTDYFATYGTRGTALTALTLYLRKRKKANQYEENAQTVHVSLTHDLGTIKARQISGSEVELAVHLEKSSGVFFTVNTGVAIS